MKKIMFSALAVAALMALPVVAQERQGSGSGGFPQGGAAAPQAQPDRGGERQVPQGGRGQRQMQQGGGGPRQSQQGGGEQMPRSGMQQRSPDVGREQMPGGQGRIQRGNREMQQRNWQQGRQMERSPNEESGQRWQRGERGRNRDNWRGPAAASTFVFLGGPRIVVQGYGGGWCRGLHRGYHRAPGLGWHRGTHRGLYRC